MVSSPFITSPLYDPKQHDQVTMNLSHYLFPAQLLLDVIVGTEGTVCSDWSFQFTDFSSSCSVFELCGILLVKNVKLS